MTEQNLIEAGFKRTDVSAEESGDKPFYYYTLDMGSFSLITPDNDTIVNNEWSVEFFNHDGFEVSNPDHLLELLRILDKIYKPKTDE